MRSDREGKVDAANPRSASLVYDHLVDLRAFLGRDVDAYTASRLSRPLTGGGAILFAPFDSRPVLLGPVLFRRSILLRCPICPAPGRSSDSARCGRYWTDPVRTCSALPGFADFRGCLDPSSRHGHGFV